MGIQIDLPITLQDGGTLDIGVANGKVCLLLKITDPSQIIQVDASTTALAITKQNLMQIQQRAQALVPLFAQINLS